MTAFSAAICMLWRLPTHFRLTNHLACLLCIIKPTISTCPQQPQLFARQQRAHGLPLPTVGITKTSFAGGNAHAQAGRRATRDSRAVPSYSHAAVGRGWYAAWIERYVPWFYSAPPPPPSTLSLFNLPTTRLGARWCCFHPTRFMPAHLFPACPPIIHMRTRLPSLVHRYSLLWFIIYRPTCHHDASGLVTAPLTVTRSGRVMAMNDRTHAGVLLRYALRENVHTVNHCNTVRARMYRRIAAIIFCSCAVLVGGLNAVI